MRLVVQIKLLPDADQAVALLSYMRAFNDAANEAACVGFEAGVFSVPSIHKLCYYGLRKTFKVSSQTAVRAIGKASECLSVDKTKCPKFRPNGAIIYDERTFSFKGVDRVSLLTMGGRILVPYFVSDYFSGLVHKMKGQADLIYRDGKFFLLCTADVPEPPVATVSAFLGVDLGIVNIASDSEGERHTGSDVERHRKRHQRSRTLFQRRGTKSAKRRLKKLSGRQSRYQKQVNHTISKKVVAKAKALGLGIAIEDLKGIRTRCEKRFKRKQRSRMSNWSFSHLRLCLTYKARLAGVALVTVNPRDTSRTCSSCGHCDNASRKSQDQFSCTSCGHTDHADHNAAKNVSRLGQSVNLPQKQPS